jgi:histidine triad (HIT) family protein
VVEDGAAMAGVVVGNEHERAVGVVVARDGHDVARLALGQRAARGLHAAADVVDDRGGRGSAACQRREPGEPAAAPGGQRKERRASGGNTDRHPVAAMDLLGLRVGVGAERPKLLGDPFRRLALAWRGGAALDRFEVPDGCFGVGHGLLTLAGSLRRMASDPDCIFCKIVAGEIPARKIDEDDRTISFMDINPGTHGHALVIPKEHSKDLLAIGPDDLAAVAQAAQRLAKRMPDALGAEGVNLINSCGSVAWQTVFHFHLHVIPRYSYDTVRLPWTPGDGGERLDQAAEALRA